MDTKQTSRATRLTDAAILLLFVLTLWTIDTAVGVDNNPLEFVRYGGIVAVSLFIMLLASFDARRHPPVLHLTTGGALLVAFFGYTALSVVWSAGGTQSLLKDLLLVVTVATCLLVAALRPLDVLVRLAMMACGLFIVLGVLAVLFAPGIGVESAWGLEGKWRGISGQKNNFGALVAIGIVYAVTHLTVAEPGPRRRRAVTLAWLVWTGGLALCLVMSGSRGAQLSTVLGLAALAFARCRRRIQNVILFSFGLIALPLLALVLVSLRFDGTNLDVAGFSFDTSSRTLIWSYGLQHLAGRELLGFGPSGFWTTDHLRDFLANHGWVLDNFHSGYITALVEGGLVGLTLLLAALAACFSCLRRQTQHGDRAIVYVFCFFVMNVAENLVENLFGRSTDFHFVTFLLLMLAANNVARPYGAVVPDRPARPARGPAGAAAESLHGAPSHA